MPVPAATPSTVALVPAATPAAPAAVAAAPAASLESQALALLSAPRVAPYMAFFKPGSDAEHLGCYLWGQAVSASLHPFLGLAEVVLRNAIHTALSKKCSSGSSESFPWYDRAVPGSIPLHGKSLERIEDQLCQGKPPIRKSVQPTPDALISSLTFGFWPNVMESLSSRHGPSVFTEVLAHHPHSKPKHWSILSNKADVVLRMKRLQDVRNRVCHFEPVWKPHWLGVTASNWSHAVVGLRGLHKELEVLVGWCSPEAVSAYRNSFGWNWFNRLCTTAAVKSFMAGIPDAGYLAPIHPPQPPVGSLINGAP